MIKSSHQIPINQLLSALPESEYQRLSPYLQEVTLRCGTILYQPEEIIDTAYFPNTMMISLVSIMENGSTTEIGLVGNEGMIGIPIFLGGKSTISQAIVQIEGNCFKISANVLRQEFHRGETLQKILLLHTQARLTQVSQSSACNRQHKINARLARWILSVHDCVLKDEIPLTQEFISNMLGVRRAGVTMAANSLQKAGMIRYNRGKIVILNHKLLEETACECYRVVQNEFLRLLGSRRG